MSEIKKALNELINAASNNELAITYANDINDGYSNLGINQGWFSPEYYFTFSEKNVSEPMFAKNINPAIKQATLWNKIENDLDGLINELGNKEEKLFGQKTIINQQEISNYIKGKTLIEVMNNTVNDYLSNQSNPLLELSAVMQHIAWREHIGEHETYRLDPNHKKYAGKMLVPYDQLPTIEQGKDNVIIAAITDRILVNAGISNELRIKYAALKEILNETMASQDR